MLLPLAHIIFYVGFFNLIKAMTMKDSLGDRMKNQYENRYKLYVPRRTYLIIRIDGKAFHNYTKGLEKPFDNDLCEAMNYTTECLCKEIQGTKFGYTQSDEISILITDFDKITTNAWFDGNIQKIASVSASIATAYFNKKRWEQGYNDKIALFDSRLFVIPDRMEVENYFIWRQKDCTRNSISMAAQSLYSHKELTGKSSNQKQEMVFEKGVNWNEFPIGFKNGRIIIKKSFNNNNTKRFKWDSDEAFTFTKKREYLSSLIPKYETEK